MYRLTNTEFEKCPFLTKFIQVNSALFTRNNLPYTILSEDFFN